MIGRDGIALCSLGLGESIACILATLLTLAPTHGHHTVRRGAWQGPANPNPNPKPKSYTRVV